MRKTDQVATLRKRWDEEGWYLVAPESQEKVEEAPAPAPPTPLLIPEIEKESNQTFEVIFGIGKKDVVVGLDKMGICTSLGMEPVGSKDFGRY